MVRMSEKYIGDKRFKVVERAIDYYIRSYVEKGGSDFRIITPGISSNFIKEANKRFKEFQVVETSLALDGYKVYQIENV